MIDVGIVVDAWTRTTPVPPLVTDGVKVAVWKAP